MLSPDISDEKEVVVNVSTVLYKSCGTTLTRKIYNSILHILNEMRTYETPFMLYPKY